MATARDEVAGETPGALRAEAVAPREARAAEAVGVAIAARVAIVAIVAIVACALRCDAEDTIRKHVAREIRLEPQFARNVARRRNGRGKDVSEENLVRTETSASPSPECHARMSAARVCFSPPRVPPTAGGSPRVPAWPRARSVPPSLGARPRPAMGKGGISPGGGSGRASPHAGSPSSLAAALGAAASASDDNDSRSSRGSLDSSLAPIAGMWVGESWPSPELLAVDASIPTNPIRWSLALDPRAASSGGISAFGAGCFDDSADVPGHTELWFTLRGSFDARTGNVQFEKVYERPAPSGEVVRYVGRLHALNGPRELTGTWNNVAHGTEGTWSCQLVGDARHASGDGVTNERSSARNADGTTDPSTP